MMSDCDENDLRDFGFLSSAIEIGEGPSTPTASSGGHPRSRGIDTNYQYEPLTGPFYTRLITLLPSTLTDDDVNVELKEVDLGTQPVYEALSYTWGDVTQKVAIKCDGRDLFVTSNCELALRELRQKEESRTLWVDAICIDQSSIDERNQQVRNMGDIYSMAKCVVIWLGPVRGAEPKLIEALSEYQYLMNLDKKTQETRGKELAKLLREGGKDIFYWLHRKPWFMRMWCLQEVALARDALVVCGGASIPWSVLVFVVRLIRDAENDAGEYGVASMFLSTLSHPIAVRDLLWGPKVLEYTISAHDVLAGNGKREADNLNHLNKARPVTTMLHISLLRLVTEPKDRIFGLHSMLKKLDVSSEKLPLPDYNRDLAEIYREAARLAIEEDHSLWILNYITSSEETKNWASWVPTWVEKFAPAALEPNEFTAAKVSLPKYTFSHDGSRLTVKAKIVDRIMLKTERSTWVGRSRGWENAQIAHIEEDVNMIKTCHEWMILFTTGMVLAQATGRNRYGDNFDHNVAFIRALLHDFTIVRDRLKNFHDLITGFYSWQRYLSAKNPDSSLPLWQLRGMLKPTEYDSIVPTLSEPYQRCLMSDEWVIIRGIRQDAKAELFHTQASIGIRAKSFFITETLYYGTATASIETGDKIILAAGLDVPLVVRATEQEGHYKVIGPAFVSGMMEGELWDADEQDLTDITFV